MSFSHLVIIETSGNQAAIFGTNRLRENAGSSELTFRTRRTVLEAVREATGEGSSQLQLLLAADSAGDNAGFRRILQSEELRNELISAGDNVGVDIVVCTSGKSILRVSGEDVGRAIVRSVTANTLIETPGIIICGVVHLIGNDKPDDAIQKAHQQLQKLQSERRGWEHRFPMIPIAAVCNSSGRPAAEVDRKAKRSTGDRDLSATSLKAQNDEQTGSWSDRIQKLLYRETGKSIVVPATVSDLDAMQDACNWLAVVHADGNGLGEIFTDFVNCLPDGTDYYNTLRKFSCALEAITEKAFAEAVEQMKSRPSRNEKGVEYRPIVPLILGGDDLTVVVDGTQALAFTLCYLRAFERELSLIHI